MTTLPRLLTALAVVATILTACPSPEPVPVEPSAEDLKSDFVSAMHGRRDGVRSIHDAIVAGTLPEAREAGRTLARVEVDTALPETWAVMNTELEFAVKGITEAVDLNAAAADAAVTVGTCGSCHRAAGAQLQFEPLPHPDRTEDGSRHHMVRHQVAARALWQAVVSNSDEHWNNGLTWLAAGPVEQSEFPEHVVLDDRAREFEALVHGIAAEGHGVTDPKARVTLYGRLIAVCAGCHAHTQGGPASVPSAP
ncbi:MAG: hypothetical protein GY898_16465 [Proteobacteria bacterium]|nr:hypothetical protein [Pseudomonadota bacterium]